MPSSDHRREVFTRGGVRVGDSRTPGIRAGTGGGGAHGNPHGTPPGQGGTPPGLLVAIGAGGQPSQTVAASAPPFVPAYQAAVLADTPAAYWQLDEGTGAATAVDSSGNGRDLSYFGGTSSAPVITVRSSWTITVADAVGSFTSVAGVNANGKVTLEAWIKTTQAGASAGEIMCSDDLSGFRYFQLVMIASGSYQVILGDTGNALHSRSASVVVNDGLRHHIVATYDGATIRTYTDGVQDGTGTADAFTLNTGNSNLFLGLRRSGGVHTQRFAGTIDEAAIYTSALTASRVAAHYLSGTT